MVINGIDVGSLVKDEVENVVRTQICRGQRPLADGQKVSISGEGVTLISAAKACAAVDPQAQSADNPDAGV